ncbi:MAG TPA: TonB-dependent receptor [Pyrinomonadaceae bacterium]|nr:TonB-dependent receptor [Pyrinomonadaceae bacterium]
MKTSLLTLLFILLFLNISTSNAQDLDTVTIAGRVLDQNAAVIPGAEIKATSVKTGAPRMTTTNVEGKYKFIQLEPGTYVVRASFNGFATQEITNLTTVSSQTLTVDFTLIPSDITVEPIVITSADAPVIDTKRTVVGVTLTSSETALLPLPTRSVLDLIFTLPGVTEEPLSTRELAEDRNTNPNNTPEEAGTFALSGSPAYSNNLTIDGLDNNDDRSARERFQLPLEAVDEVQVITNQFSAEYGRASGGRVNLRTRGGSSDFRGRGVYFFRDESLNANSFHNNSRGLARLPLQEHVVGFTFSGPVKLTNSLFFVAFESNKILDSALIDTLVPVEQNLFFPLPSPTNANRHRLEDAHDPALGAEVAPLVSTISTPSTNTAFTSRVDQQFTQMHNLTVVYQRGRLTNLRQFGGGNQLAETLQGQSRNSDAISLSDNFVFGTTLINQARFQYSRLAPAFGTTGHKPVVLIALNDPLTAGDPERRSGTLIAGSSTSGSTDRREVRIQFQNILSQITGNHSMKFGLDYHRVHSEFIDLADITGTFNFASAGDFLANTPSRFRQTFDTKSTQRNTYLAFFIHDEWQILPQLLLSYGVRYERESILADSNNFGPRLSLAYNPLASGRLVMRLGGGIFYNRALLRTIDDFTLAKQQLFFDTNLLRDPITGKLMTAEQRRSFISANLNFPETLASSSGLVKQFGELNKTFSRRLDPKLRIPESYQVNFGIERDLGRGYSVEANLTWTRGIHLWREFNVNAPRLPSGYSTFTSFLASRDFANFRDPATGSRPIYNASTAGELVRFAFQGTGLNPNTVSRVVEFGVPVSVINLNSPTSTTALEVALAALNDLRPDPSNAEVEQLISAGNSFYRGLTVEVRRKLVLNEGALKFTFRAGYTLSTLIDDGVVNTSDALVPGDFRAERARSLLDRRHRFVFSGVFNLPGFLGSIQLSPIWRVASGAPFNISLGGTDRNLDDVGNDRPNFSGDRRLLHWRAPDSSMNPAAVASFSLPAIGQTGNLPRNAGHGPGQFVFDLNMTREFRVSERVSLRPVIEFGNVLNKSVFSFGSEFINFNALSPIATEEQRQAFLDSFLLATRTMRPRQIRVGMRVDF